MARTIFDIPAGRIKRFEIIRPHTTLKKWYAAQADKPDVLFNASLYSSQSVPCGTLWENGKLASSQGNGWGFGTRDGLHIEFGSPFVGAWKDYLTAYPAIVRGGHALTELPWVDKYVFNNALVRIAFGRLKSGDYAVFCENGKTILQFAKDGADAGFDELCNLDGGGSRALLFEGKWVYTSNRIPYNGVAIWYKREQTSPTGDGEGGTTMKVKCTKRTQTYDSLGRLESGRYIDAGDVCEIGVTLTPNLLCEITYPIKGGTRKAYTRDLANFTRG